MGNGASATTLEETRLDPKLEKQRNKQIKQIIRRGKFDPQLVVSFLQVVLPNVSQADRTELFSELMTSLVVTEDHQPKLLAEKAEGVVEVHSGPVSSMKDDPWDEPVAVLGPGDFCCEMSILFKRPATANVKARAGCKLLAIERAHMDDVGAKFSFSLVDWVLQRRYLWLEEGDEMTEWFARFMGNTLKQLPAFHGWPQDVLHEILTSEASQAAETGCPPWFLVIYPAGALLMAEGEPAGQLKALLRGSVLVKYKNQTLARIDVKKYPFTFGEQGFFMDVPQTLTVITESACLTMQSKKEHVTALLGSKWGNSVDEAWQLTTNYWQCHLEARNSELYDKYGHLLAVEMLYKMLRITQLFSKTDPLAIQLVARVGMADLYDRSVILYADMDTLYLIIRGALMPVYSQKEELLLTVDKMKPAPTYRAKQLANADRDESHTKFPLHAEDDTIVVKFPWPLIADTLEQFTAEQLGHLAPLIRGNDKRNEEGDDEPKDGEEEAGMEAAADDVAANDLEII